MPAPVVTEGPAQLPARDVVALAAVVTAAAGGLVGLDWRRVQRDELVEVLVEVERARSVLDAVVVGVVGRIEATRAGETQGWASTAQLVTAVCGGGKGSGPGLVRLVQRLADLAATRAGMAQGWLSRAQAAVIAARVTSLPHDQQLRVEAEQVLLEAARSVDAADLDRSWPRVLERLDPDGTRLGDDFSLERRERAADQQRHLSLTPDRHGGVKWSGYSSVEDAELVRSTLMPLAAPQPGKPGSCGGTPPAASPADPSAEPSAELAGAELPAEPSGAELSWAEQRRARRGACPDGGCGHDGRDSRDGGARLLDALVTLCAQAQARSPEADPAGGAGLPTAHGASARMLVTTTLTAIRAGLAYQHTALPLWHSDYPTRNHDADGHDADGQDGGGGLPRGPGVRVGGTVNGSPLSVAAVRRLACDAQIIPAVLGSNGQVLDLGRSQRLVSTGQWHALVLRDAGCAFPGCGRLPIACDVHHIQHWADGGPTDLNNLVVLCRRHHTLLHTTPWQARINPEDARPEFKPPPRRDRAGPDHWHRHRRPRELLVS